METSMTIKGQVVIPAKIRQRLGLKNFFQDDSPDDEVYDGV